MSREKTLVKNTFIYLIGNFASKFLTFILLPIYTIYLSTEDLGYFDLVNTYISLIVPLITLSINEGMYRYLLEAKDEEEKKTIISSTLIVISCSIGILIVIGTLISINYTIKYFSLIIIMNIMNIIYNVYTQILRGLKLNKFYSTCGIIATFITLLSNLILIVCLKLGAEALIIANILSFFVVIIVIMIKLRTKKIFTVKLLNKDVIKKMLTYSIPLLPNVINWWVMSVSDRVLLQNYVGIGALGVYAIANKFPNILAMFNSIFYMAWQESSIIEFNSEDRDDFYTNMFEKYSSLQITSTIVLLAITPFLMKILIHNEYTTAWMYIPFLYLGNIMHSFSSFYGTGYQSSKKTKGAFVTSIIGALVNIIINIMFIPIIGIHAAAISTFIAFLIMWLLRLIDTRKYFKIKLNFKKLIPMIMILILYVILYYINNILINCFMVIGIIPIAFMYNKEIVVSIFNIISKKIIRGKK